MIGNMTQIQRMKNDKIMFKLLENKGKDDDDSLNDCH